MAARRLEHGMASASAGEGRHLPAAQTSELSGQLHDIAQDLGVIADAIAALAGEQLP